MDAAIMFVAAAILLTIAGYAQYRIRFHTIASRTAMLRGVRSCSDHPVLQAPPARRQVLRSNQRAA